MGQLFPEVFAPEVPRVTVAIAATAVCPLHYWMVSMLTNLKLKVVLDEITSDLREVNFRVATYSPVYVEILGLMSKCDSSLIHWAKTQDLRVRWAQLGRYVELQCISLIPLTLLFEATACLGRKATGRGVGLTSTLRNVILISALTCIQHYCPNMCLLYSAV